MSARPACNVGGAGRFVFMPYSGPNDPKLPEHVQEMPESDRAQWAAVWNSTFEDCMDDGGSESECEGRAFQAANGVVSNTVFAQVEMTVNNDGDLMREETMGGRPFLVVPVVAGPEGVMNQALYTTEEWLRSLPSWNGRPITAGHPEDEAGNYVSANSPEFNDLTLGWLYNVTFEDGKFKGEMWLDKLKVQQAGGDPLKAMQRLERGEMVEVSTGLFGDALPREGEANGKQYNRVIQNILPDHLAILLHGVGACSIEDGCGAPRVNVEDEDMDPEKDGVQSEEALEDGAPEANLIQNETQELLRKAVGDAERGRHMYILDVFPDEGYLVYELEDEDWNNIGTFRRDYTITEEGEVTIGDPSEVIRRTTYMEAPSPQTNQNESDSEEGLLRKLVNLLQGRPNEDANHREENPMDNLIEEILANEECGCGFTQEELEAMPETAVEKLHAHLSQDAPSPDPVEPTEPADEPEDGEETAVPAWAVNLQASVDEVRGELATVKQKVNAEADKEKEALVQRILGNEKNQFGEEELKQFDVNTLQKLAGALQVYDYSGRGFHVDPQVTANDGGDEWEPIEMPSVNGGGGE